MTLYGAPYPAPNPRRVRIFIAEGPPETIAQAAGSYTGKFLTDQRSRRAE